MVIRDEGSGCLDALPDDILIVLGCWVANHDIHSLVMLQRTCQRFHRILSEPENLTKITQERNAPDFASTLGELNFYVALEDAGLIQENRIGFDFASLDIESDEGSKDSDLKGSTSRIRTIRRLLGRFWECSVTLDAHCGTLAPSLIAPGFSQARGMVVCEAILGEHFDETSDERVVLNSWGRRVTDVARLSSHRFGDLARQGKGWVEIYVKLGDLELPLRPDYWDGIV